MFKIRIHKNQSFIRKKNCFLKSYQYIKENYSLNKFSFKITNSQMKIDTKEALLIILEKISNECHQDFFNLSGLKMVVKIGFDGAQTNQNIHFMAEENFLNDDSHVFIVAITPLFIFSENIQIWCNPTPGSVDYCYPLEIIFSKDTDVLTKNIYEKYNKSLTEASTEEFRIEHFFTMVDQKAINAAVQTNISLKKNACSNRCYICSKLSYGQNSFQQSACSIELESEAIDFGLNTLHGLLNIVKYLIYNVAPNENNRIESILDRINTSFKINLSEIKHGFGSTLTGNLARRFLNNPEIFAECTKLEMSLIVVVKKILADIRSFEMIDLEIYESNLLIFHSYIKKIRITPTIHKYLSHSVQIINFFQNTY